LACRLGCALVAHWAARSRQFAKVRGALLVAPTDVEAPSYPPGTTGFAPMPLAKLPFPSIVVSSTDDEYVRPGHINSASGLPAWPEGFGFVEELRAR